MQTGAPLSARQAEKPAGSRQHLLDTAARLFSTIGYTESGMRQIAQVAGMQTASVYYHFASKDVILLEVLKIGLDHTSKAVYAAVASLPPDANARDKLEAAISAHLRAVHSNLTYTSVNAKFAGQLPVEVEAIIQPRREEYINYWSMLLEQARKEKLLRPELALSLTRALIMGMIQRTAVWFDAKGGPVDALIAVVLEMLSGMWTDASTKAKGKTQAIAKPKRASPATRNIGGKKTRER